jgi:3-phenylpropionate/cinnamic acid dioxygenase small subunit
VVDSAILAAIDALQTRYIGALQAKDMTEWLDCFDRQGSYLCIGRENVEQDLPLALMMDDCYERLLDRVNYVTKVWSGTYEDYTTRHFVQRLKCRAEGDGYVAESNFMVVYVGPQGTSEVLVSGQYEDQISCEGGNALFRSKKAILDTIVIPRYLVYPV